MDITDNHTHSLYKTPFHFTVLYEQSCRRATGLWIKTVLAHGYRTRRYRLVNTRQAFMQVLCITLANTISSPVVSHCFINIYRKKDGIITFY
ncbi:hypothetical protein EHJ06_07465 [Cronobacter malonaticus]|nr:hypothetical protein [Cronobacter malonaticus]NCH47249.1 hypothetical protein [Cronobacter malonaticus]NCH51514.1 hypothetical protein [Cronobacter malonaticus]